MIPFKDKTFCVSHQCKNECGRKMTKKERKELERMSEEKGMNISQGYFCGEPKEHGEHNG